jgi:1,2-diacylglycerol 3-alpha-glucosyltransferase
MKIAMFSDYFYPELGGIQDSIATISRALGRRGHRIDIHAPCYSRRDYARINATEEERDLGANVGVIRRASLPFPSSTGQTRAALPSLVSWAGLRGSARPDVIHAHSCFGVGLEALLDGAVLGIPVVATNHTTLAGMAPHMYFGIGMAAAWFRWFHNRCDYVTAPSHSVFEEVGFDRLRRPHQVISNPIDTALFSPASAAGRAAARLRLDLPRPTIAFAGRLGAEKNIEVLLRAMASLASAPDAPDLAIAGHGAHGPALRALAAELGIAPRVRFLGTLGQPDLASLLQASDIFVMMSTSETQSMAMLQAMACGVCVVAANSRALPEFVGPANGVLADPHDSAGLARILGDLLACPERRRELGAAGRRSAENYSVETVTDMWEATYRALLDRS